VSPPTVASTTVVASRQVLEIRARDHDARARELLVDAHDLGVTALHEIRLGELIVVEGLLDDATRAALDAVLVDPLLQIGTWNPPPVTPTDDLHIVEATRLPGVTDPVTAELIGVIRRRGLPLDAVAAVTRYELVGPLTAADVDWLSAKLLTNPIIERASRGRPVAVTMQRSHHEHQGVTGDVEYLPIDAHTTTDQLEAWNTQRGLALDAAELEAVRAYFVHEGRHPTDVEVEMLAQTWSEHCSHKTFRAEISVNGEPRPGSLLGQLRDSTETLAAPYVVSAFVGNAGIVSFVPGETLALKCETHNHPSAVEPFGGANTGVGGVIRDILGAAHTPIACTNIVCFGPPDTDPADLPEGVFHPRRVRGGVIAGIADYGNKIGLPTVAGAVLYDEGYLANPLVYAGCIGLTHDYEAMAAPRPGDRVIVMGGRTGRDGLRGATFSSMTMDATTGDVAGASVQIGDPIVEKLLIDVLRDARHLYRSITDCGAGGLSSAVGEMAEGVGAEVEVSELPLKYPGLSPWEVWLSEAQERMVLAVPPHQLDALAQRCRHHGVEWTDIGHFTGDGRLVVRSHGTVVVDLDTEFLHNGRPRRHLEAHLPAPDRRQDAGTPSTIAAIPPSQLLLQLLAHPNLCSRADVVHRYDHEIGGATVVRPLVGVQGDGHGDGVVLAEPQARHGVAIGVGVNPWFGLHDPERMALAAIDEAMRNVVAVGADPDRVALLDNFSWGNPRRPSTLGDLVAAVEGCVTGAHAFGAPFVSGKDSLNNEFTGADRQRQAVPPTLVITAVAHVPDADATVTADAKRAGNLLVLLGDTSDEWAGSHAALIAGVGETPVVVPAFDTISPQRYRAVHRLIANGRVAACHDVSEGGLAVAVAEMAIGGRLGVRFAAVEAAEMHAWLFAESTGRLIVEIAPEQLGDLRAWVPGTVTVVGELTHDPVLTLPDGTDVDLDAVRRAWEAHR